MESADLNQETAPHPHLNELIQDWYKEHADKYPNGAEIAAKIHPESGIEISVTEVEE